VDIGGGLYGPGLNQLLAVYYNKQGRGVHYLDAGAQQIHLAALSAFPGMQSELVSFDASMKHAIVWVGSPATHGSYYLYAGTKRTLTNIMDASPWLDASQMSSLKPFSATARDGLTLHGYLVTPHGANSRNLPLIVSISGRVGGSRHTARFDEVTQF